MSPLTLYAAAHSAKITQMNLSESLLMSLLGMGIVMLALVAIMSLVKIQSAALKRYTRPAGTEATAAAPAVFQSAELRRMPAPGSAGKIKLHAVSDRTAALIMAVVADELQVPLNELRFISIREV